MNFSIHNPSWLENPDPAEAFEAVKAKAQWAEQHGDNWNRVEQGNRGADRITKPLRPRQGKVQMRIMTVLFPRGVVGPRIARDPRRVGRVNLCPADEEKCVQHAEHDREGKRRAAVVPESRHGR